MRSEDKTLAGAPLCSLLLTFLSLSTHAISLGEVLPACWMRKAGVEAKGSAALWSWLAVAAVDPPRGRGWVVDPWSCPIRCSCSCYRCSLSTSSGFPRCTEFKYVPVEDIVVGESLRVEEVAEEQVQVQIVGLVIEPQGEAEDEVC